MAEAKETKSTPQKEATPAPAATATPAAKKKDNTAIKVILIVVGVVVLLMILGAIAMAVFVGSIFHQASKNVQVDGSGKNGRVTIKSNDGQSTSSYGSNVNLPKNFPTDIPIYKPSTLISASATENTHFSAAAKTNSSVNEVLNYYRNQMVSEGWTSVNESSYSDGTLLSFKKANRSMTVSVSNQKNEPSEKTLISIGTVTLEQ